MVILGLSAACPSFVSLEISHDGQNVIPTSPPLVTCSLAVIKLQLLRPEVVNVVTLRLHRPRDSTTIGLQQVCLRGQRAFGEMTEASSTFLPCEDTMTRCRWVLAILVQHCVDFSGFVYSCSVIAVAVMDIFSHSE